MKPDSEGFYYPIVNTEKCINCGLCKMKCPTESHNLRGSYKVIDTFCGRYNDPNKVISASSGGLCDAVAHSIIEDGGVVYGAGYSDDFHGVIVRRISKSEDLHLIKGSKYVQTIKKDGIYKCIKADIQKGLQVLYIGLPCDVAAVKNHVGDTDKLITIEIICSGVPSPEIHKQFVIHLEDSTNEKITNFTYRKKQHGWHWPYVEAKCGDKVLYNKSWSTMELGYAFMTLVRPSCYHCKFKSQHNLADITAGDFWGLKKNDPRYYSNGVSAIITHTQRGTTIVKKLKDFGLQHASYDEIIAGNPRLYSCPKQKEERQKFSELFIKKGLREAYKDSLTIHNRIRNIVMAIYSILNFR